MASPLALDNAPVGQRGPLVSSYRSQSPISPPHVFAISVSAFVLVLFVFLDSCFGVSYAPISLTFLGLVFLIVVECPGYLGLILLSSGLQDILEGYPWGAAASVNLTLALFLFPWKEHLTKHGPLRAAVELTVLHTAFAALNSALLSLLGRHLVLPSFPPVTTGLAVVVDLLAGWKLWHFCVVRRGI